MNMSPSIYSLFLYHYISVCIAIHIAWKPWINLPIQNSQMIATHYLHSIVIIGGTHQTNTIYKINSSATIESNQTWQNFTVQYPHPIIIKNDNYFTIGRFTNIFGVPVDNTNTMYTFDHTVDEFVENQIPPPPEHLQTGYPCTAGQHPYIYLIGGVMTSDPESSDSLHCSSTTLGYNFMTDSWQIYSTRMPWDNPRDHKMGACYNLCKQYGGFIYLFGGLIGGDSPTNLTYVYALDTRNGPRAEMKWIKASNVSIDNGIINTHSLLIKDTVYTFSHGAVQSIQFSESNRVNIKIDVMQNDKLTPQRCATGNAYDAKTHYIYAIGGCDCSNCDKFYSDSQISQNMTTGNSDNHSFDFEDWVYFAIGFIMAISFVCVCTYCYKYGKHANQDKLVGGLQNPNGNITAFSREGSDTISILAKRPQVDI